MNYKEECYKLINDIKHKLSKLYLNNKIKSKYEVKISEITTMLEIKNDEFVYYEAFLEASKIEASLSRLINSKKDIVLPPCENKTYLKEFIKMHKTELEKYERKIKRLKVDAVSYILTGAIFLTTGIYILDRDSQKPNHKLYLTESKTYCDNVDKTHTNITYTKEKSNTEVIIKKIMPWVLEKKEATRLEYTYRISNMSYDEIIESKDYEKIIANLECFERVSTMPIEKYSGILKYQEPIYEINEIRQDKDAFIEQKRFIDRETALALFGELLIYLTFIGFNNKPIYESILIGATDIKSTGKIINANLDTLKLLKKQYAMTKQKTLKK